MKTKLCEQESKNVMRNPKNKHNQTELFTGKVWFNIKHILFTFFTIKNNILLCTIQNLQPFFQIHCNQFVAYLFHLTFVKIKLYVKQIIALRNEEKYRS